MNCKKENNLVVRKDLIKHTWFAIKLFLSFASALVLLIVATFIFAGTGIVLQTILNLLIIVLGITSSIAFIYMAICIAIIVRKEEVYF